MNTKGKYDSETNNPGSAPKEPPLPEIPGPGASRQGVRVLIVETDLDVRLSLQDFFELSGYEVVIAEEGEAALRKLSAASEYDLILLDDQLPWLERVVLLTEMRKKGVETPILLLSGQSTDLREHLLAMRAVRYLPKPFNSTELIDQVGALMGSFGP